MSRPSFQFYPGDWRNDAKLRRCSEAARGAWVDILCVLHDSDEYGVVRWPLADLARAAGVKIKSANELVAKGVLKGSEAGCGAYVWRPFHGGKYGDPVTLLEATEGPTWYSTRLIRDEYGRINKGAKSRFSAENQPPSRRHGDGEGDGSSSPSSSSPSEVSKYLSSNENFVVGKNGQETVKDPVKRIVIFQQKLIPFLGSDGGRVIDIAMHPGHPEYARCLALCKKTAWDKLKKGWPHLWPQYEYNHGDQH
jgi:hypothetical protein